MRVRVLRVSPDQANNVYVMSAAGAFEAEWAAATRPVEGRDEDVELELLNEPTWGIDLVVTDLQIGGETGAVVLQGHIEDIQDVLTIRLGDGLLLVEPLGLRPEEARVGPPSY